MRIITCLSLLLCLVACGGEEEECWDGLDHFEIREADGSLVCMPDPSEGLERCLREGSYVYDGEKVTLGYRPERDCTEAATLKPKGDTYRFDWGCFAGEIASDKCVEWRPHTL